MEDYGIFSEVDYVMKSMKQGQPYYEGDAVDSHVPDMKNMSFIYDGSC